MNILVTGVYGFLGTAIANHLVDQDYVVYGLYNKTVSKTLNPKVTVCNNLEDIPSKIDIIYCCHAAVNSGNLVLDHNILEEANINATKLILEQFPAVKTIYISTISVYKNISIIKEKSKEQPSSYYAKTKLQAEHLFKDSQNSYIVRLSSLYGPNMKENTIIPNYVNMALQKNKIEVWGKGKRLQNYIYIKDVLDLLTRLITFNDAIDFPLLAVGDKSISNLELAKTISAQTQANIIFINEDSSDSYVFDNTLTQKTLNWTPKFSIEKGLMQYISWKKKQS